MSNERPSLTVGSAGAAEAASQEPQQSVAANPWNLSATFSVGNITISLTRAAQDLLKFARALVDKAEAGNYEIAVIFAHAACDLHTELAIRRLLAPRPDKILGKLAVPEDQAASLDTARVRKVYLALTGDNVTEAEWWDSWSISRQDRHDVAHRGAPMTRRQAQVAIGVAELYIAHITEKVDECLKNPP